MEIGCALALLLTVVTQERRTWPIYLTLGVFGASRAFWGPAMQAMLPGLVARGQFAGTVALNSMLFRSPPSPVRSSAACSTWPGPKSCMAAACALTLGALLMLRIRANTRPTSPPEPGGGRHFLEGLRFVWRTRLVLGVISLDLFAVLFGGAVALLPIFARDILHTGPAGLGLLRAGPGIGAALAAAWLALRPARDHVGRLLLGGVATFGLCMVVFGLSRNLALSVAALIVSGCADMLSVYVRGILVPLHTPDALRGASAP